jgi:hypothetical protein
MRLKAYENASIYKERIKRWYDKRFKKKEFKGDKVQFEVKNLRKGEIAKQVGVDLMLFIRCSPTEW